MRIQFVKLPMHQTNILDLVLCENDQLTCDVASSLQIGHSDHSVADNRNRYMYCGFHKAMSVMLFSCIASGIL